MGLEQVGKYERRKAPRIATSYAHVLLKMSLYCAKSLFHSGSVKSPEVER